GRGALPAVAVLQPDDVVEVVGGDLEDRRVLQRGDAVDGARTKPEACARPDHLLLQHRFAGGAELELRPPLLDEPRLVLYPVELEAERLAGLHEQHLAHVVLGLRPNQLVPPRLVDLAWLEPPGVEALQVGRVDTHPATLRPSDCGRASASARDVRRNAPPRAGGPSGCSR